MTRCVIYCRVSTDAQERNGTSLDTQERACIDFAAANGWTVTATHRDTTSGFTLERAGLTSIRSLAAQGHVDVVLSYALDRLSRKQTHVAILVEEMEERGVHLDFVTEKFEDTATGQLLRSVKAFAAEFEREKIAERTMRGKAERARSGRLPQGTGAGCYGYTYEQATGQRELEPFQATVVRRIFERYSETRSFSAVSRELNEAAIPALAGGRWYPLTIRRMLTNETYTGHTVYRRTKRVSSRAANGRRRSEVIERPLDEHIAVPGASPPIIDAAMWRRVQTILHDPERARRQGTHRHYALGGRARCGICSGAMVGQTLKSKGREYSYYRCRHSYDTNTGRECSGRYVRADALEAGTWTEVRRLLASPEVVLRELTRSAVSDTDPEEADRLDAQLKSLKKREARLVRLFGYGEVNEDVVETELADIRRQQEVITERLKSLQPLDASAYGAMDEAALHSACTAVGAWFDRAGERDREQVLEALQVSVTATQERATVAGVLPLDDSQLPKPRVGLSPLNEHRHDYVDVVVLVHRLEDALAGRAGGF